MQIVAFKTVPEQTKGLLRYRRVPKDTLFVFPFVHSNTITTVGLTVPIRVIALDRFWWAVYNQQVNPGFTFQLPRETVHVIEMLPDTPFDLEAVHRVLSHEHPGREMQQSGVHA